MYVFMYILYLYVMYVRMCVWMSVPMLYNSFAIILIPYSAKCWWEKALVNLAIVHSKFYLPNIVNTLKCNRKLTHFAN